MSETVNLDEVREMLVAATSRVAHVHGTEIPGGDKVKDRPAALAQVQKELLFLSHLCERARMLALDEYHLIRGFNDHVPDRPAVASPRRIPGPR